MSVTIKAKTDYTYLFSSLGTNAYNAATSNFLVQYASIKNGSYAKLLKAYYSESSNSAVNSLASKSTTSTVSGAETKALTKVESTTDSLKDSADALLVKGSKSLFATKDVVTGDENGVETTAKGYDTDAIYKAVSSFVDDYNAVIEAANDVSSKTVINRTASMVNATAVNEKLLNKTGITINEDNTLSLDKETFESADMATVKSLFNGNGSYAYRVSAQASMINFAADQAASRSALYTTNGTYNNTYSTGVLFNSYF